MDAVDYNAICKKCGRFSCSCGVYQGIYDFLPEPGIVTTSSSTILPYSLLDLHEELGRLKWLGNDDGWDEAITAVRKFIREKL